MKMMVAELKMAPSANNVARSVAKGIKIRDVTNRFFHEPNEHETSKQSHEPSRAS